MARLLTDFFNFANTQARQDLQTQKMLAQLEGAVGSLVGGKGAANTPSRAETPAPRVVCARACHARTKHAT